MNNKIVPASSFYNAMNTQNENLIKSSFNFQTTSKGYYTPMEPIPGDYLSYASQLLIKYTIEVNYNGLLQSAYNLS